MTKRRRKSAAKINIHKLVEKGNLKKIKTLLDEQPELVNATDQNGRTPLHLALMSCNAEVCTILTEHGASFDAADFAGNTPIHVGLHVLRRRPLPMLRKRWGSIM